MGKISEPLLTSNQQRAKTPTGDTIGQKPVSELYLRKTSGSNQVSNLEPLDQ